MTRTVSNAVVVAGITAGRDTSGRNRTGAHAAEVDVRVLERKLLDLLWGQVFSPGRLNNGDHLGSSGS